MLYEFANSIGHCKKLHLRGAENTEKKGERGFCVPLDHILMHNHFIGLVLSYQKPELLSIAFSNKNSTFRFLMLDKCLVSCYQKHDLDLL
jgi:hypothetical protein